MTLPPVVTDPDVCPKNMLRQYKFGPHEWMRAFGRGIIPGLPPSAWGLKVCRYCGDRQH